jgi:t-SNARE complex subunit (syntaxin)
MVDRLKDLRKGINLDEVEHKENFIIEIDKDPFLHKFELLIEDVNSISDIVKQIEINSDLSIKSTTKKDEDIYNEIISKIIKKTNRKAILIKSELKTMRDKAHGDNDRMQINMSSTIIRKFSDVMKTYRDCQLKHKNSIRNKIKHMINAIDSTINDKDVDMIIQKGNYQSIYQSVILGTNTSTQIENMYTNVLGKHHSIIELEASIGELHQMFIDFATLVDSQGVFLDNIEVNVNNTGEYIGKGNEDLDKSIELLIEIRKRQCCIAMIVFIIISIIIGVIILGIKIH